MSDAGSSPAPDEVKRILRRRAETLAKPLEEASTPGDVVPLLVFSLAAERYGIETTHVVEAIAFGTLTPVPCTPACILGVMNHRGRVAPILDLQRLLSLPGQAATDAARIVVVQGAAGTVFGIVAESLAGIVGVGADEMAPPPASLTDTRASFIKGVSRDMIAVLDVEALGRDPRVVVNAEVG